jgi:transcription elongation factor GreA
MTVQLPDNSPPSRSQGAVPALMTADTLNELREELEQLRRRTRQEIAERLREARAYGAGSNNDEHHAVVEEQMVLEARLRSLEDTIARASIVDRHQVEEGLAVIGSVVVIEDMDAGTLYEYRLGGDHEPVRSDTVSVSSPMGQALLAAAPGTIVTVDLPHGRSRTVRLAEVVAPGTAGSRGQARAAA